MPAGRKTKYTPDRVKRIIDALAAGNTRRAASAYGGIDEATLFDWINKKIEFSNAVKSAESQAEVRHVANIAKAANDGSWQASAWWLERRQARQWGRVERHELTGQGGGPIEVTNARDDLASRLAARAARLGAGEDDSRLDGADSGGAALRLVGDVVETATETA